MHRAARICVVARRRVLVSQATQSIIEDQEEDPGFALVDLGECTLKDLDRRSGCSSWPRRVFRPGLAGCGAA
jgi:class 3 adenylate cyclase